MNKKKWACPEGTLSNTSAFGLDPRTEEGNNVTKEELEGDD